jgi:hypothetical protein
MDEEKFKGDIMDDYLQVIGFDRFFIDMNV